MALLGIFTAVERLLVGLFPSLKNNLRYTFYAFAVTLVVLLVWTTRGWWVVHPIFGVIAFVLVAIQSLKHVNETKGIYNLIPEGFRDTWEWLSIWYVLGYVVLTFVGKMFF